MYELKNMSKSAGVIDIRIYKNMNDDMIVRECCERGGLLLMKGLCFGSRVASDAKGDRFALMIRRHKHKTWVEFSLLRKNQKLEMGG